MVTACSPSAGLADDRQAVVLQQAAQRGAHGRGVVGDQHPGRRGGRGCWDGLLHRRMVPAGPVGGLPARRRRAGRGGLVAGGRDPAEVQAEQQGGDRPVERWWVATSQRSGRKVQTWWHPKSWIGGVLAAVSARPRAT